jgi:hypothetical protein
MSGKLTGSSQKLNAEVTCLVREVIQALYFNIDNLVNFNSIMESRRLDSTAQVHNTSTVLDGDGWKEATAEILILT